MGLKPWPAMNAREVQWTLVSVVGLLGVTGLALVWMTAPLEALLGESASAVKAAVHGVLAGVLMVAVTIGFFQAIRLLAGHALLLAELQVGAAVTAMLTLLVIISGNWLYIPYRAGGGPRAHFMAQSPEIHRIFFEFKEFAALFTIPLAVCAAYLFCRYGEQLIQRRALRTTAAVLLILLFFYFMVAFGLGAAITKLRPV